MLRVPYAYARSCTHTLYSLLTTKKSLFGAIFLHISEKITIFAPDL